MGLQSAHTTKQADKILENLMQPVRDLQNRMDHLEASEFKYLKLSETNTNNPPTAAQLTAAFGSPSTVGKGFTVLINDAGLGSNFYLVASDGTNWWVFSGSIAV